MRDITPGELPTVAVQAAVKVLWDKRSMLPEYAEDLVDDVLCAALPHIEEERVRALKAQLRHTVDSHRMFAHQRLLPMTDAEFEEYLASLRGLI